MYVERKKNYIESSKKNELKSKYNKQLFHKV